MKPINTALCSFGMSGYVFHAPFIDLNPNFNLYGVLERRKNLAQEKYPSIKTFRSLDELLQDDAVDLVVVNTPNITHYDFTKKALNAGKHVVVEKPFTTNTKEAKELIELAEEKNLKLSVYHNRRWDSDFKTVKKIINQDILGEIVDVELHFDRYDPGLSYKSHKEKPTEGVGSLYDLGSHIIDQALQLFGMPIAVFAIMDTFREASKVYDYFDVKLYYNSFYVTLKSSYFVREELPAYIVHGTKGSFLKLKADIQEEELQKDKIPNIPNWGKEPETEKGLLHTLKDGELIKTYIDSERGDYKVYYEGIYEAIKNNKPLPVTAHEATQVIEIIEAAYQSKKDRKVIDLK